MSTKTYHDSCHCGKVQFEADIDLDAGTGRCNCSICSKLRNWSAIIKPEQFRLLSGAEHLGSYVWGPVADRKFCRHCGVSLYGIGHLEEVGGDFCSVSIAALDDVAPEVLASIPIRYFDGRHNHWENEPAVKSYL
ncbi:MAG: GFA family protein [Rhodomicrobiaceae bacterium]